MRITIRDQVKAAIIGTMAEAEKAGRCPLAAAEAAYPGVPMVVLGSCYGEMVSDQEGRWWEAIERTIDSTVIRKALSLHRACEVGPTTDLLREGCRSDTPHESSRVLP